MPDWCDICDRTLRLADWQHTEHVGAVGLVRMCEECFGAYDVERTEAHVAKLREERRVRVEKV